MGDVMLDPNLDLSMPALMRACEGNIHKLPDFVVHDDETWPQYNRVMVDKKNRLHIRRSTFLHVVAGEMPVRAGIWIHDTAQLFHLQLEPHHIQGASDAAPVDSHEQSRRLVLMDEAGRTPEDEGYGDALPDSDGIGDVGDGDAAAPPAGPRRGVRSTVFSPDD